MKTSELLELMKSIFSIFCNKPLGRICRIIKYIACFLFIISYIDNYNNLLDLRNSPLLSYITRHTTVVGSNVFWISLLIWVLTNIARDQIARAFVMLFHDAPSNHYKGLALYTYVEIITDLLFSIIFLLYAFDQFDEYIYCGIVDYRLAIGCTFYLSKCMLQKIYYIHQKNWEEHFRKYSGYCDANQKELYENSRVVYKGKKYEVICESNRTWILLWKKTERISLETAVQDKENAVIMVPF